MNNNKETSVDWIFDQLSTENLLGLFTYDQMKRAMEILEQAKAMHKEEVENTWYNGYLHQGEMFEHENVGEEFYNQTYGGNK